MILDIDDEWSKREREYDPQSTTKVISKILSTVKVSPDCSLCEERGIDLHDSLSITSRRESNVLVSERELHFLCFRIPNQ